MIMEVQARVLGVNESKGKTYATFNDVGLPQGGQFKMSFDGTGKIKNDQLINLRAKVQTGLKDGLVYIRALEILPDEEKK